MQLEYILQAHGINRGGGSTPLPEIENLIAISKDDGTGINLSWTNSVLTEYVKTEIFESTTNITGSNYEYCTLNTTKVVDSASLATYESTGYGRGTTVYYKGFMTFNTIGEMKQNKGTGTSCVVSDIVPPGAITNFTATGDAGKVTLGWTNPTDLDFNKTKILYKLASYPTGVSDGTVAYEGSGNSFVCTGLTDDLDYYFRAFTYDNTGNVNAGTAGQQIIGTPSDGDDNTGSPGSKKLIAGTMDAGYFGVVPANELYTGAEISTACGITAGTLQFNDVGWLKFAIDGKIVFKSQKTYRHTISWDNINATGCVKGTKQVSKGGHTYKVRLMKGALTDPSRYDLADRGVIGSEWNRLMLPIHIQAKDKSWAYPAYVEATVPYWGIDFADADLQTHNSAGSGSYHWCQEVSNDNPAYRVLRGYNGVSYAYRVTSSYADANYGWSPVLEWIS